MNRYFRSGVVAAALLGSTLVVTISTEVASAPKVAAHTTGGSATGGPQWHPWASDGCTKAVDSINHLFNFAHACEHHDGCYVQRFSNDKNVCDSWFLNDMRASCQTGDTWPALRAQCEAVAWGYYYAVRACGGYSWDHRSVATPVKYIVVDRCR
jgi:hypothetical protein